MVTIDGFIIDATLTESHTYESDVTSYPTESGSTITDNIRPRPVTVQIDGIVSDTPIGTVATTRANESTASGSNFEFLPSDAALAKLLEIRDKREPITIETSLKRFESMALTQLEIPRDAETGMALRFSATFQQITIVTNNRTTIRVASPNNGAKKKKSAPPVVFVHNGPDKITTRNGYDAAWNPKKGRYEYATKKGQPGGTPVPNYDLNEGLQSTTQPGTIPESNSTYFDQSTDQWRNTDGSPVTQQQLNAKQSVPTQGDDIPWWKR